MAPEAALLWIFYSTICSLSCVNTATTQNLYPLEFITQDYASASAMMYGFQLLEDIRRIRMGCEERRDELERQFTLELQNWMKYSQQTQRVISRPDFEEQYSSENRQTVEDTITSTYKEIYSSRTRRLNVIEHQCDEVLEKLLQQRKTSLLILIAELTRENMDRLNELANELLSYKTQLNDGLESCIERQRIQYESRLSSKLLPPEDYCSGPDIDILTAFLGHMLIVIMEEMTLFFGDDEDLGMDIKCGISGCREIDGSTEEIQTPTVLPVDAQPTTQSSRPPPSPTSHERPTLPSQTHEQAHFTDTTSRPPHTSTESVPLLLTDKPIEIVTETKPKLDKLDTTEQSDEIDQPDKIATTEHTKLPVTEPANFTTPETDITKQPVTEPDMSTSASDSNIEQISVKPESVTTASPTVDIVAPTAPEWFYDAEDELLNPKEQAQVQTKADTTVELQETEEESHRRYHNRHGHYNLEDNTDNSGSHHRHNEDSRSHDIVIDIPPDTARQNRDENPNSDSEYRPLIYSFAIVGGVLVAATLVLVAAILIVQYKRRRLLATQLLTQEQKIAIMKQTGYINPTYNFFDKQNDG